MGFDYHKAMSILIFLIFVLTGVVAGLMAGLLGVGGGLIVVPSVAYALHSFNYPPMHVMQVAIGTSLATMAFTSASSAWAHYRSGGILWELVKPLAPGIAIGASLGAELAHVLTSAQLRLFFGSAVCVLGLYSLVFKGGIVVNTRQPSRVVLRIGGIVIGSLSSLLGIGGGILTVPLLTACGTPLRNAISTSALTGILIAGVGSLSFLVLGLNHVPADYTAGYIYWPALLIMSSTSLVAAPWGAKLAYTLPLGLLKRGFGIFLILAGMLMIA